VFLITAYTDHQSGDYKTMSSLGILKDFLLFIDCLASRGAKSDKDANQQVRAGHVVASKRRTQTNRACFQDPAKITPPQSGVYFCRISRK